MTQNIKCAYCGAKVPLAKDRQRPKQHKNGDVTCVGSSQLISAHHQLHAAHPAPPVPKRRKV